MKTSKQINLHTWSRSGCKVPTLPTSVWPAEPNSPTSPSVLTRLTLYTPARDDRAADSRAQFESHRWRFLRTPEDKTSSFSPEVGASHPNRRVFWTRQSRSTKFIPNKLQHGHAFSCNCITLYWWMWYFYFYKLYMYLHHSYCYVCSYNHNQVDPVLSVEQQSAVRWPPTRNEPLNWPQACDELMHDTMHVIYCTIRDTTNDYYH